MRGAQSISTRRAYGVQRVCRVWHCARSSVYARRQATRASAPGRRRGPMGAAPDDVLVGHIRRVLEAGDQPTVPANKKKDPGYAGICRDIVGHSGMRPGR